MLVRIDSKGIYRSDNGWCRAHYHFAYAEYSDSDNTNFGVLCAFNEFVLEPGSGFDTHPHEEMEIVSYCVEGDLTHRDSLGNSQILRPGEVQHLRAGSGLTHSELNNSDHNPLRFIQIWFRPREARLAPAYRHARFPMTSSKNRLLRLVSGEAGGQWLHIEQDADLFVAEIEPGNEVIFTNERSRQSYLFCIDGTFEVDGSEYHSGDALKVSGRHELSVQSGVGSHVMIVNVASDVT